MLSSDFNQRGEGIEGRADGMHVSVGGEESSVFGLSNWVGPFSQDYEGRIIFGQRKGGIKSLVLALLHWRCPFGSK